jgi:phosphatidylserine decarboxylase
MSGNGHRLIAREGMPVLLSLLVLTIITYIFVGLFSSLIFLLLIPIAGFLFREPVCDVPATPLAIISPASGKVLSVTQLEDPWLSRSAIRVRIKILPWDVHSLRSPIEGKVMNQWSSCDAESEFERQIAYWIKTDEGDDLLMALGMNSGAKFTRMGLYSGNRAGQGQRCGFMYLTGVIDIYLPENSRVNVKAGQQLMSGTDTLGQFVHLAGASAISAK